MSGKNMQRKSLPKSYVKVDSIFTIEKRMIAKVVARLKEEKIEEVKMKLAELFEV